MPRKAATPGTDRLSSIDWLTGRDSTIVAAREMPATAGGGAGSAAAARWAAPHARTARAAVRAGVPLGLGRANNRHPKRRRMPWQCTRVAARPTGEGHGRQVTVQVPQAAEEPNESHGHAQPACAQEATTRQAQQRELQLCGWVGRDAMQRGATPARSRRLPPAACSVAPQPWLLSMAWNAPQRAHPGTLRRCPPSSWLGSRAAGCPGPSGGPQCRQALR